MDPLIPPGTLVTIDAKQTRVRKRAPTPVASSSLVGFGRPIYFLDVRDGYRFGWCEIKGSQLTLIPHPDSPVEIQSFQFPMEVEVVGRIIVVSRRIDIENLNLLEAGRR